MKSYIFIAILLGAAMLAGCSGKPNATQALNPQQAAGKQVFDLQCAGCHKEGRGGPQLGGMFKKSELPSGAPANDERVRAAILDGRAKMPPFKYMLTQQQVNDLLAYLHTL